MYEAHIQTCFKRIAYDVETRTGHLDCGPNDMPGSIALFTAIDPAVCKIISSDMVYRRRHDGEWDSLQIVPGHRDEQRITLKGLQSK